MRLVWADVVSIEREAEGVQHVSVRLSGDVDGRAIAYPPLVGHCAAGDRVLLNTTAVDLALGTGGVHFVVARGESSATGSLDSPGPGHIMKLRYTPLQIDTGSVEEQDAPHHDVLRDADSLDGMPVVCCSLHSHVPLVAAALKARRPDATIAYCMTDGAALPYALSDLARACRDAGLIDASLTCGQAFGADFEAVNLHSGLLAARFVLGADAAIVAIGPGVVGTATRFGHGGVAQGEAVNAVASLGGTPVFSLRLSFADPRERHRGVSHHSIVALARVALAPARVAVPYLPESQAADVDTALSSAGVWDRHLRVSPAAESVTAPDLRGITVRSMGRGIVDDPAFFAGAFAAGDVAAGLIGR